MGRKNEFFLNFWGERLKVNSGKYIIKLNHTEIEGEGNELYFL